MKTVRKTSVSMMHDENAEKLKLVEGYGYIISSHIIRQLRPWLLIFSLAAILSLSYFYGVEVLLVALMGWLFVSIVWILNVGD